MLARIITGGQTGTDQAAWRTARAFGIPTGGFMPRGYRTEDGPRPDLADEFGAAEIEDADYAERRRRNVQAADAVLLFGSRNTPGSKGLIRDCELYGKPYVWVEPGRTRPSHIVRWLQSNSYIKTLMAAGNRESKAPGIGARVE